MLIISSVLILSACGTNKDLPQEETTTPLPEETLLSNDTQNTMSCPEAIQAYLDAADLEGNGEEVKSGDLITVDYIGRLPDGSVFDTSVESVARACGTYSEGRNYTEGLEFKVGEGQMIAGFDKGVVGMKLGQTKSINIPAAEGYGERMEELVYVVPISEIPNANEFEEGATIMLNAYLTAIITQKTDQEITFDANHFLAGKDLIFDVTIKAIN
ncbi:MAG: FKBP-type peptidyl-prolyl cis-trans isomerase [Candidatus Absconditabacteria bacterium]|nr:FKBP-type peptidyl-prolyl cis-trans isomerase [Candidatus Absconditabacteria bacterium]